MGISTIYTKLQAARFESQMHAAPAGSASTVRTRGCPRAGRSSGHTFTHQPPQYGSDDARLSLFRVEEGSFPRSAFPVNAVTAGMERIGHQRTGNAAGDHIDGSMNGPGGHHPSLISPHPPCSKHGLLFAHRALFYFHRSSVQLLLGSTSFKIEWRKNLTPARNPVQREYRRSGLRFRTYFFASTWGRQSLISCTKAAFSIAAGRIRRKRLRPQTLDIPSLVGDLLTVSGTAPGMNPRMRVARGTKKRTNLVFLRASCE
jgi:hypothetical protein